MEFFENNKKLSLNILNQNVGYKTEYHIQSLFTWFTNSEIFSFIYKEIKESLLCKSHCEANKFYSPLISIDKEDILCDRVKDIIYNKFANSFSICEFCSYTSDKKIKQGNLYSKCITKTCIDIISPYVISLCFELTNIENG